jgi:hypothetical protein
MIFMRRTGYHHANGRKWTVTDHFSVIPPFSPISYISVSDVRFTLEDTIFVNPNDSIENKEDDAKTFDEKDNTLWVATIKDIRAKDPSNVLVRVQWFYRPEELPGGRQPYHGKTEIINTTLEDIIPVCTVAGRAKVTNWDETNDNAIEGLIWRQTFNYSTERLSVLLL